MKVNGNIVLLGQIFMKCIKMNKNMNKLFFYPLLFSLFLCCGCKQSNPNTGDSTIAEEKQNIKPDYEKCGNFIQKGKTYLFNTAIVWDNTTVPTSCRNYNNATAVFGEKEFVIKIGNYIQVNAIIEHAEYKKNKLGLNDYTADFVLSIQDESCKAVLGTSNNGNLFIIYYPNSGDIHYQLHY